MCVCVCIYICRCICMYIIYISLFIYVSRTWRPMTAQRPAARALFTCENTKGGLM